MHSQEERDEARKAEIFALEVIQLLAQYDDYDSVWWRCDGQYAPVTFFVNCNDVFHWACADAETLTAENLPRLRQALVDAKDAVPPELHGESWGPSLFCARERAMRPQKPFYDNMPKPIGALFDRVGEPR